MSQQCYKRHTLGKIMLQGVLLPLLLLAISSLSDYVFIPDCSLPICTIYSHGRSSLHSSGHTHSLLPIPICPRLFKISKPASSLSEMSCFDTSFLRSTPCSPSPWQSLPGQLKRISFLDPFSMIQERASKDSFKQ